MCGVFPCSELSGEIMFLQEVSNHENIIRWGCRTVVTLRRCASSRRTVLPSWCLLCIVEIVVPHDRACLPQCLCCFGSETSPNSRGGRDGAAFLVRTPLHSSIQANCFAYGKAPGPFSSCTAPLTDLFLPTVSKDRSLLSSVSFCIWKKTQWVELLVGWQAAFLLKALPKGRCYLRS